MKPSQAQLKAEYERNYNITSRFQPWASPSEKYAWLRMKASIKELFLQEYLKKDNLFILDLGCGLGTDIFMLDHCVPKNKGAFFCGIDISKTAIDYANNISEELDFYNGVFRRANIESLRLGNKWDIIICSETIEHTRNLAKLFQTINLHLKKDGALILSTPNDANHFRKLFAALPGGYQAGIKNDQEWQYNKYNYHDKIEVDVNIQTAESLLELLTANGFKIDQARRGSLVYGGEWLDRRRGLFAATILGDWLLPKTALNFSWDIVLKAVKRKVY